MTKDEKKAHKQKLKQLNLRVRKYKAYMEETYIEVDANEVLNKNTISDAILGMEEDNKYIPFKEDIEIIIKNALPTNQTLVRNKIETQLVARLYEINTSLRRLYKKIIITFLIGVVSLALNVVFHFMKVDNFLLYEILAVLSWVFLWTTVDNFYFDRHELTHKRALIERMYFANYTFDYD